VIAFVFAANVLAQLEGMSDGKVAIRGTNPTKGVSNN